MNKKILTKCMMLMPIVILLGTMYFINYTIRHFKDSGYIFTYDTNVGSVQRFSRELAELSAQGYSSTVFGDLYTKMILNYSKTLGEKEGIITFLVNDERLITHSTDYNQEYLHEILQNEINISAINAAFETMSLGEIVMDRGGEDETFYYHHFNSGPDNYCIFMCVERDSINLRLQANDVIIPVVIIGLLLIFVLEYAFWLKMNSMAETAEENEVRDDSD